MGGLWVKILIYTRKWLRLGACCGVIAIRESAKINGNADSNRETKSDGRATFWPRSISFAEIAS